MEHQILLQNQKKTQKLLGVVSAGWCKVFAKENPKHVVTVCLETHFILASFSKTTSSNNMNAEVVLVSFRVM